MAGLRVRLRALLGLLAVVVIAAVVIGVTVRWTKPTGEKLAESLSGEETGFAVMEPCEALGGRLWRCFIEDDPGSGASDAYRLRLDPGGCWSGARTQEPPGGQPLSGCI